MVIALSRIDLPVAFDEFYVWLLQPEDSNSKVAGNRDILLVKDTIYSISSVLRKEIEGKVSISKPKVSSSLVEGKDSLGESILDAKDEWLSTTSLRTLHKGIASNPDKIIFKRWKLIGKYPTEKGNWW